MKPIIDPDVDAYCEAHSDGGSELLDRLAAETRRDHDDPQMMVGNLEGAFLAFLARTIPARRILEVGTYTGYSAIALAGALPPGGELHCVDRDPETSAVARRYLDEAGLGERVTIHVGDAREIVPTLAGPFDLVFLDADKGGYVHYLEAVLPQLSPGGVVAADNVLWSGRVLDPRRESDRAIAAFNDRVQGDPSLENVLVPIRDGIMLVRRRSGP